MNGIIKCIRPSQKNNKLFGIIAGSDGEEYYFDNQYLVKDTSVEMSDFSDGEKVTFRPGSKPFGGGRPTAYNVSPIDIKGEICVAEKKPVQDEEKHPINQIYEHDVSSSSPEIIDSTITSEEQEKPQSGIIKYYTPGFPKWMDLDNEEKNHLKEQSGEIEVIKKLSKLLRISYINHHDMGHGSVFPFCIVGATEMLKQYIRGQYEFLMLFSHFRNGDWQQSTLKAIPSIRQRKTIADRRPLVNFYILISNARNLQYEINRLKGGTEAAIIPFSFEEILTSDLDSLRKTILQRFDEFYFENNMLGEENAIEDDTLLFGDRGKIADSIVQRCIENGHSGIFGLRRSGKTSVLRAVVRRLRNNEIKHVMIGARSLETIDSWKTALFSIARSIREVTLGIKQGDEETKRDFYLRLNLNSTEEEYQKDAVQCFSEDVRRYTKDESTFVIAIDEIELITYNTATSKMWQDLESYKGFWSALRECGCSLIVCGVNSTINEESTIVFKGGHCDNPMYQRIHLCADFSKTYLPAFTDNQTKEMINTLGSYSNVAFDKVYVEINSAFGGQPYAIRQFCAFMFDQIKNKRLPGIEYQFSKPTFEHLIIDFCNSEKGIQLFKTILQHVTIYTEENEMLKRLAHAPEENKTINPQNISLIDHLEKYGLIEYDKSTYFVSFRIHSLKDYIVKTSTKRPEDMNNEERIKYVQEKVMQCEKKLKAHIMQYYLRQGKMEQGRNVVIGYIKPKTKIKPTPDPQHCKFEELFDHKKYEMYFSNLRIIISNNWSQLGSGIQAQGMSKDRFCTYMEDLNAGRTDADHYDPEDFTTPDDYWDISLETVQKFKTAYESFEEIFKSMYL